MKLYDQFFDVVKKFRQLFSGGPARNSDVSGSITAEILIIVSFLLVCLLIRHVSPLLAGIVVILGGVLLVANMPLIPKFKVEQEDSLDKMLFYAVLTLGILITFIYWGGNLV